MTGEVPSSGDVEAMVAESWWRRRFRCWTNNAVAGGLCEQQKLSREVNAMMFASLPKIHSMAEVARVGFRRDPFCL
jgi:hypothetical protein